MNDNTQNRLCLNEWGQFFIEHVLSDDVPPEIVGCLIKHLVDLEVLSFIDEDIYEWRACDFGSEYNNRVLTIQKDLELLCASEPGFALSYFIGYKNLNKKSLEFIAKLEHSGKDTRKSNLDLIENSGKPASNLSNLQIVKKVGKQLQPFLQLEEAIISRLIGKHVSKQDAQKMFHYMFSKIGAKAEPRIWEQLSRKKHR
jgi:hypothetical protein